MFRSSFFAFCHIYNYKGHKRRLKAGDKEIMNQDITGILNILSANIRNLCTRLGLKKSRLIEVRLRVNEPLILMYDNMEYMVTTDGRMKKSSEIHGDDKNSANELSYGRSSANEIRHDRSGLYIVTMKDINETVEHISKYSLYAYEDEVRQGFITIEGGHRVGIAGKVTLENGRIKNLKHITFLNIRIAHEVKGCGSNIIPYIVKDNLVCHTLIISPPRCGKTTLLRDIVRQLSDGSEIIRGQSVGVVDERSEIAACFNGMPQNDVGMRTDILDCCPKAYGMMMLIRSMSPAIIAVDEIGSHEDIAAIYDAINSGCKIIATVHGNSVDDVLCKPGLRKLVEERVFERYIVLNNKGHIGNVQYIFDERGSVLA